MIPTPWTEREQEFRAQFARVIERQCGPQRSESPEEMHGSWVQTYSDMGWTHGGNHDPSEKTHPDLVPYAKLDPLERDKDSVFLALCEIARLWIREEENPPDGETET